jgi:predicted phosphodiesterase
MRLAALSDIHGNLWALEAALADIRSQGADLVVNLGDILSGPLEPGATADLLMTSGLPTIAGNHERQLLACEAKRGGPSDQYAFDHTTPAQRAWLRGLPGTLAVSDEVFLCHGTPQSDLTYLLEEVRPDGMASPPDALVEARAATVAQSLILCGHSHLPRTRALSRDRLVVNPGSVGLQAYEDEAPYFHRVENGTPHLRYALCDRTARGWNVTYRLIEYDHESAAEAALSRGRPEWARWLRTGRTTVPA